ncbi:uncharacterized protein EDB91DRAFT_1011368, partial [Suillus paluster]|uniref:uncharacterized protein n=1 Tax=Suillus paluster TaxID=48578 RepID=UPI001B884048
LDVRKLCFRTTLRMTTLPLSHPLARGIKTAHNFCTKHGYAGHKGHPSSLHELLNEFKINQEKMEKITPICQFPKWIPDVTTSIAQKEEEAVKEEETADEDLRVYSDGSAIDGGVGAAAVLMRGAKIVSEKRFHLGSDKDHTVYDGEVVGMILAVKLL